MLQFALLANDAKSYSGGYRTHFPTHNWTTQSPTQRRYRELLGRVCNILPYFQTVLVASQKSMVPISLITNVTDSYFAGYRTQ